MTAHTISAAVRGLQLRPLCAWLALAALVLWAGAAGAQEPSFTYQGQLIEAGTPANGDYDFQFALFDNDGGGTQIGATQTLPAVVVSNGLFTVDLNFGISPFTGENRFLDIAVRPAGSGSFTTLAPRQFISWAPYAIHTLGAATADSLSSACTGCVGDIQIQSVSGSKVSGAISVASVPAGSGNYVQNRTTEQPNASFNIDGNGVIDGKLTVGGTLSGDIVNADSQFNIGGERVLSKLGSFNLFAGAGTGQANTDGAFNSFFGHSAGFSNTTGSRNSFFGDSAGATSTGSLNTFVGVEAGSGNLSGNSNIAIGYQSFLVGGLTGATAIGANARVDASNASAIGFRARVSQSNSLVLGSINGVNNATADTNVGIGTTAPTKLLHLRGLGSNGLGFGDLLVTGTGTVGAAVTFNSTGAGGRTYSWISTANSADPGGGRLAAFDVTASAYRMVIDSAGNVGIGTTAPTALLAVNGTTAKPGGGSWGTLSDERLKTIKGRFTPGVEAVMQLEPIRYEYKPDNTLGIRASGEYVGFGAHAVQKVIPEAVTTSDQGYLMVNNDPILWTMLNAIKEQQHAIEKQQHEIERLREDLRRVSAAGGS